MTNRISTKTIFLSLAAGQEIRNFLHGDLYKLAREKPDVRLVVFVPSEKLGGYLKDFAHERCSIEPYREIKLDNRLKKLYRIACFGCIPTRTIWSRNLFTYLEEGSFFSLVAKQFFWVLGHMRPWRAFMRWAEYNLFHDDIAAWKDYFIQYKPDVVFGAGLLAEEDFLMVKYAKRLGIPTAGMMRSWDNFTSKGFLRVHPDVLLVQNKRMAEEAVQLNSFPRERIRVVGFPQWDHYLDPQWHLSKEEFAKLFNLDSTKRWITYFGGGLLKGLFGLPENGDHVVMLNRAIERGEIKNACTIIRAHPGHLEDLTEEAKKSPVLAFGKGWNFTELDIKLLLNLIRLSDVTLNLGSTIALEAAIFDKPMVLLSFLGFTEDAKLPWHRRAEVAFKNTVHYRQVIDTGGLWRVTNEQELVGAVAAYLENPALHHEGRSNIVKEFVGPLDGRVGERILEIILSACT